MGYAPDEGLEASPEPSPPTEGGAPAPEPSETAEGEPPPAPPIFPAALLGVWRVASRETIGDLLASRRGDPSDWSVLTLDGSDRARVEFAGGRLDVYGLTFDAATQLLTLTTIATLTRERPTSETMTLAGDLRGHALTVQLARRPPDAYLLSRRGFRWINEVPFNRY